MCCVDPASEGARSHVRAAADVSVVGRAEVAGCDVQSVLGEVGQVPREVGVESILIVHIEKVAKNRDKLGFVEHRAIIEVVECILDV